MNRRKGYPTEAAALAQYAAINAAMGLPQRDAHIGAGRHVDQDTPQRLGWTLEACSLADGPGPTVYVLVDETIAATVDGQTPPGHARIDLSGRVAHAVSDVWGDPVTRRAPAYRRRAARTP